MNIYTIKICKEEDKPMLIDFIRKYWKEDHIFVKSKEMFDFQHYNPQKKEYNFIIGINNQTKEIDGINGLIPLCQYDTELAKYNETWGAIWKVRSDVENDEIGLLGILLFEEFKKYTSHGGAGMSIIAKKLLKVMKYNICILNQYYILNSSYSDFRIANIPGDYHNRNNSLSNISHTVKRIFDINEIPKGSIEGFYKPTKSLTYLLNRYQKHPIYEYSFLGIYNKIEILTTILVTRSILINNRKVIRIVDVLGPLEGIGSLKNCLTGILNEENAEYIDIINYGIPPDVFIELGFEQLNVDGNIIIPNYFEPFIQKNIVIEGAYKAPYDYVIFKGDSDQDRPSII